MLLLVRVMVEKQSEPVFLAQRSTALYQDDCDSMTGRILLLSLQGEQMIKTATHRRLYDVSAAYNNMESWNINSARDGLNTYD